VAGAAKTTRAQQRGLEEQLAAHDWQQTRAQADGSGA
jgi:hypothetical protein